MNARNYSYKPARRCETFINSFINGSLRCMQPMLCHSSINRCFSWLTSRIFWAIRTAFIRRSCKVAVPAYMYMIEIWAVKRHQIVYMNSEDQRAKYRWKLEVGSILVRIACTECIDAGCCYSHVFTWTVSVSAWWSRLWRREPSAGLRLWRPWCTQKNEAPCPNFEIPSNRCSVVHPKILQ